MTTRFKALLTIAILLGAYMSWDFLLKQDGNAIWLETDHYTIHSTATQAQTALIGEAAESLYVAYMTFFDDVVDKKGGHDRLKLRLFRDKKEFADHNISSAWAEAFYREPFCHAYFPAGERNPFHWMLHEGTHQLNNEIAGFRIPQWIDEGLAAYFGTSSMENGKVLPGRIDVDTYPIWWLPSTLLTGNLRSDIENGRIIPLRNIISGNGGPDIDRHFNLYYIHYWSLTHFLFHHDNGKYSSAYRVLIAEGGSIEGFEREIGPINRIQDEWYDYLQRRMIEVRNASRMRRSDP